MRDVQSILEFLRFSERLKLELRHSWLSDGRRESVAEHCWQMALMAVLMYRHLDRPVDIARTLKMILVHDLAEAEAGDIPVFEVSARKRAKAELERAGMETIRRMLPDAVGDEVVALWEEFEARQTPEAKFAAALDHLEVQAQHNLADFATWEPVEYGLVYTKMDAACAHDPFLAAFCAAIKDQAEDKMRAAGVDVAAVKDRVVGAKG